MLKQAIVSVPVSQLVPKLRTLIEDYLSSGDVAKEYMEANGDDHNALNMLSSDAAYAVKHALDVSEHMIAINLYFDYLRKNSTQELDHRIQEFMKKRGWMLNFYSLMPVYELNPDISKMIARSPKAYQPEPNKSPKKLGVCYTTLGNWKLDPLPPFLYHVTPKKYLKRILSAGLTPRQSFRNRYYSSRVYVVSSLEKAKDLVHVFHTVYGDETDGFKTSTDVDTSDYTILRIDTSKLPKYVKFFADPEDPPEGGRSITMFYTSNHLPPSAVKEVTL